MASERELKMKETMTPPQRDSNHIIFITLQRIINDVRYFWFSLSSWEPFLPSFIPAGYTGVSACHRSRRVVVVIDAFSINRPCPAFVVHRHCAIAPSNCMLILIWGTINCCNYCDNAKIATTFIVAIEMSAESIWFAIGHRILNWGSIVLSRKWVNDNRFSPWCSQMKT